MSAGTKRSNADEDNADEAANTQASAVDGGPGLAYMPFVVMEDLLDKLKLLNYEEVRGQEKLLSHKLGKNCPHSHCPQPAQHHFSALSTSPKMLPNFSSKEKIPKLYPAIFF